VANSFAGRAEHLRLGYAPRAFPVIPNGIDVVRFRPDREARDRIRRELGIAGDTPVVVNAARLDPMKDLGSLIDVAKALPHVTVLVAGAGTESLQGPPNLVALGVRTDMPALYAAADLALSSSAFGEGFSNFIAEAMACGLPVVATEVGDARLIIDDDRQIVPPRNVAAMAAALSTLLEGNGTHKEASGMRGRDRIVSQFSLERCVRAFDALHLDAALPEEPVGVPYQSGLRATA
jgi:glycosyltransferase involved in cell wall biosynthesis